MTHDPDEPLARGLAWGLLAATEWTEPALRTAAARAFGHHHRWLPKVVRPVLGAYRVPPADRPYELTRFLLAQTPLREIVHEARRRRRPLHIRELTPVPGQMGSRRWPVPEVADLGELATLLKLPLEQLDWLADLRGRQRRTPPGPFHTYSHHWVQRPGAVPRLLEAPTPLLRAVLRRALDRILVWVPVHPAAHGFVAGRSAVTNAACHVGATTVVTVDLRTFFSSITAARVNGLFRSMGYPEAIAWTLTGLCTHRTPGWALTAMPAGGDSSARHQLRAALRGAHLPQGAPTSPALANLACFSLDHRLQRYAAASGLTYSRYADDLTFSGETVRTVPLVRAVTEIAQDEGFAVNSRKTRARHRGQRQSVTGIVTNRRLGTPREDRDQLRAVLHEARLRGPEAANRYEHPNFRDHLHGRITWVESVNPTQGRRLRAQFDAISWTEL